MQDIPDPSHDLAHHEGYRLQGDGQPDAHYAPC